MSKSRIVVSTLLTWIWVASAQAVPIPGLFNTGVDNAGVIVLNGNPMGVRAGAGVYFIDLQAEGSHLSRRNVWMP